MRYSCSDVEFDFQVILKKMGFLTAHQSRLYQWHSTVANGNEELLVTANKCHLETIAFSFAKYSMHLNYFCNDATHLKLEHLLHNCLCLIFTCANLLAMVFHFESLSNIVRDCPLICTLILWNFSLCKRKILKIQ